MDSIQESFVKIIENKCLFTKKDRLLVAVSGGVDSMVLLSLLIECGYHVSAAHVNYRLRGEESDADQRLVTEFCTERGIDLHLLKVNDAESEALRHKNLQAEARRIRYDFFESLLEQHNYQYICTAHHADDRIETLWLNAMRGSGVTGLSSLRGKTSYIRRPLLHLSKEDIYRFAEANDIAFREDVSNADVNYQRNYLRNVILPGLYAKDPRAHSGLLHTLKIISDESSFIDGVVRELAMEYVREDERDIIIGPLSKIRSFSGTLTLMHRLVMPYGYSQDQLESILTQQGSGSKRYDTHTHRSIVYADHLYIRRIGREPVSEIVINGPGRYECGTGVISLSIVERGRSTELDRNTIIVDADQCLFPLIVRGIRPGDRFVPTGMHGKHKKLSRYCSDARMSAFEKEDVRLLCCGDEIIWVVGYRADDRYSVTSSTQRMMQIHFQKAEL